MPRDGDVAAMHPANCEIRDRTIASGYPLSSDPMRPASIMSAAKSLIQPGDRREVEVVVLLPGRNHRRVCRSDISISQMQREAITFADAPSTIAVDVIEHVSQVRFIRGH
jgi:hypothetical protein